jgi:hypothetical protein
MNEVTRIPLNDVREGMVRVWSDGEMSHAVRIERLKGGRVSVTWRASAPRRDGHHVTTTVISHGDNTVPIVPAKYAPRMVPCPDGCRSCAVLAKLGKPVPTPPDLSPLRPAQEDPAPRTRALTIICTVDADQWDAWFTDNGGTWESARGSFHARLDEIYADGGEVLTSVDVHALELD